MRTVSIVGIVVALSFGFSACKKKGKDKGKDDKTAEAMAKTMDAPMKAEPDKPKPDKPKPDKPKEDVPKDPDAVAEAVVSTLKGTVEVRKSGTEEFKAAKENQELFAGDAIRAGADGEASLALWDQSSVALSAESAVTVNSSAAIKNPGPGVTVMNGAVHFDVNPRAEGQGPFTVYTPSAVVAVQGTALGVGVGLSGTARIGVDEGKVEISPVAKLDAKALVLPAGRAVVVPVGKASAAPVAFNAKKPDWDKWLEAEEAAGLKNAATLADKHGAEVESLNNNAAILAGEEDKAEKEGEDLTKKAAAAEKAKNVKVYGTVQPRVEANLERQYAIHANRRLVHNRMRAHAYLLYLLRRRAEAGEIKDPRRRARILKRYQRSRVYARKWRRQQVKRRVHRRQRMKRNRRAYFMHHHQGRALAPRLKVKLPAFYAKRKLRRRALRRRLAIKGYRGRMYRRPEYRGKRRAVSPAARAMMMQRRKRWHRNKAWQAKMNARRARVRARRAAWRAASARRRAIMAKRRAVWLKRRAMMRGMMHGMMRGMMHGGPGMMRGMMHGGPGMMRGMMHGGPGMMRGMFRGMRHGMALTPAERMERRRRLREAVKRARERRRLRNMGM